MFERLNKRLTNQIVKIVFFDFSHFIESIEVTSQSKLASVLEKGYRVGYSSMIISDLGISTRYDNVSKEVKKSSQVLMGLRYSDQTVITAVNKPIREGQLGLQEHYYIKQGKLTKAKVLVD